ncbi:MAG: type I glutamate--ammonia ligase [Deltaproteobacteria bacterium]|nr:type I glutamate--ammonia ligase [Deltaproteobacteria bacterium]
MAKTPAEVLKMIKDEKIQIIDLKFMDLIGSWQHFQIRPQSLDESAFDEGVPFDGSSIRAWQGIESSDMSVVPDPVTAKIDPFFEAKTLSLICNVRDPVTGEDYSRDPRNVGRKALNYLKSTGIADMAYFGPESEFFVFDSVCYDTHSGAGYYFLDSNEAPWTTGETEGNMGYKVRPKSGYFPVMPSDSMQDMRNEMVMMMEQMGLEVERSHHEVAPAQHEINFKFDTLVSTADNLQWFKYIVKNVAKKYGKIATFMPKPMFNDNGSGMHTHQSLWKDGKPLFAGDKYAGLSEMAIHYIGGLLKHARALSAFTNPSTNSYRRLVPGFEAPVNLAYSNRNRSACIRIPVVTSPKAKRVEYRVPDTTANAYIAFAGMLLAGLDGIQNKIDPGEPLEKDIYGLPPEELAKVPKTPASLREALEELKSNHSFLLQGGVFTEDLLEKWIDYKMEHEVGPVESRPVPHEFYLYFDI